MNSQPQSFEDVQKRLLKLERESRRFRQLVAVVLAIAAVIAVMGQAPSKKTVEANEFILRDDNGNIRARLAVNRARSHGAPEMFFFDEKGNPRLELDGGVGMITDGGGQITVYDGKGQVRGLFTADVSTGGMLALDGSKGGIAAALAPAQLDVVDDNGFEAILGMQELVTSRTGETHRTSAASLVLLDKNKNVIWKAP